MTTLIWVLVAVVALVVGFWLGIKWESSCSVPLIADLLKTIDNYKSTVKNYQEILTGGIWKPAEKPIDQVSAEMKVTSDHLKNTEDRRVAGAHQP